MILQESLFASSPSIAIRTVATVVELAGRERQQKLSDFIFHTQTFLFALYFIFFLLSVFFGLKRNLCWVK
jgi:hypothetical protein